MDNPINDSLLVLLILLVGAEQRLWESCTHARCVFADASLVGEEQIAEGRIAEGGVAEGGIAEGGIALAIKGETTVGDCSAVDKVMIAVAVTMREQCEISMAQLPLKVQHCCQIIKPHITYLNASLAAVLW